MISFTFVLLVVVPITMIGLVIMLNKASKTGERNE
jgi:hypothetical protein